jgi:hyaluronan synthase
MAIIESRHETVHSSSLLKKRSKRRADLQDAPTPMPTVLVPPATVTQAQPKWEGPFKIAIIAGALIMLAMVVFSGKFGKTYTLWPQTHFGSIYWTAAFVWGAMMYAALVWRVILWHRYKPMKSVQDKDLPSVCVIIPAFNEGALVRQSILSVAHSNYPKDRLEIIAVDDGSSDDTWVHILTAARQVEQFVKITTLQQPTNRGKRAALLLGFKRAGGDVFVSIDSDSIIHPDALRNGVSPLVREPAIGCVAGCVEVLNPRESVFTRFLKCTFSLSFKFVRAYQSEFRGVFCTPGAISIYRASVVRKVAEEWANQEFLGQPCTTGEDRAMTNLFLREGWLTAYQGNAVVWTKVPADYIGMVKMLLRWGRSNIRETLFLMKFLFTDFRTKHLNAFRFNMVLTIVTLFLPPLLIGNSIALMATADGYMLRQLGMVLIFGLTMCTIYYINERDHDWAWLLLYEFFWVPALSWIIPYSCLTLKKTGWLTRKNPDQSHRQLTHSTGNMVSGLRLAGPAVAAITSAVSTTQ